MRLLAVATHPIQYQAPWYRALAADPRLELLVAYAFLPSAEAQGVEFGVPFLWDVPLLDGYASTRLELASRRPDLSRFFALRARFFGRLLERQRPEVVLLTGWNSWVLVQGLLAARRRGIATIVRGDSNDLRARPAPVRWLQRLLLSRYDGALAVGRANRAFLEARGVPGSRIVDAPHFVDNRAFESAADRLRADRASLRRGWGIPEDRFCFLFAGKLIAKKRPDDLLAAFVASHDLRSRAWLHVVGDGALRVELEQRVRAERLPVSFAGFLNQSEIPRAYVAADALVLPSDAGETWGLVVNEAMACGRPAIVSDLVGCGPDLVTPGETGWIFRCGETGELAAAMNEAAAEPERSRRFGASAQRRIVAHYTIERSVEATVTAAQRATTERRR